MTGTPTSAYGSGWIVTEKKPHSRQATDLRKRAEEIFRESTSRLPENQESLSPEETAHLLHELQVHQIELEMQNEELRRAQRELEASRERYFSLYDLAPVGYVTLSEKGLILEANITAAGMLGQERRALVKQPLSRFIVPEPKDQEDYYRLCNLLFETGMPQMCEIRMLGEDAPPFWARVEATMSRDADGSIACRVVISDVTVSRQAEALRESEARFQSVLDNSQDVIYRLNMQTGSYEYISLAAEKLTGFSRDDLMAHDVETSLSMIHPDDMPALREALERLEETGQEEVEYRQRVRSGDYLWISNRMSLTRDSAGRPLYRDGNIRDITRRKDAEKALAQRTANLEVANKELESFSYSVSHDLRSPLRAIDGYARIILKNQGDKFNKDTLRKFNDIRENAQRMGQLIDDILDLSRLSRAHLANSELDMERLIREVWKEVADGSDAGRLDFQISALPPGRGDRTLIKQVLSNLLANAVKFSAGRDQARIETGGYKEGNESVYFIRDNGVGFDMQYVDKLFGVFSRLHDMDEFEGTGVGLAIVQRIVHRHGGRVWAEGEVDKGATFYFTLPREMQ
jgi:PAS domain S-box-containing protein